MTYNLHGANLVGSTQFQNLNLEQLAQDPTNRLNVSVWYNTTDNVIRYLKNDGTGALVINTITTAEELADAISTINTSITTERTRAEAAEGANATAITNEATTRGAAVTTLTTNLATEVTRAEAAEAAEVTARTTAISSLSSTLQTEINAEATARAAADGVLQSAIDSAVSGLKWRPTAVAATSDANLIAAADGTALSTLLPFSDDEELPALAVGDFVAGNYIVCKNGASSKIFTVVDDAGTLKVTTVGVRAFATGDTVVVGHDLPMPAGFEGAAVYNYTGTDLIHVGSFNWALASGINLSGNFVTATGAVVVGDSVEAAIAKLVGNLAAEATARASADTTLQNNITTEANTRSTAITNLTNSLGSETTAREAADASLQSAINTLSGQVGGNTGNLSDLTTTNKSTLVGAINEVNADVATEASTRASAVTALTSALTTEVTNRTNADAAAATATTTAIGVEHDRAVAAEGVLTTAVATETSARTAADSAIISALKGGEFFFSSTTDASSFTVAHDLNTYQIEATVWIRRTDGKFYADGAEVQVTNENTLTINLGVSTGIRVGVRAFGSLAALS
jgi:hypothetical protein